MHLQILFCGIVISIVSFGQFNENFQDGNMSVNPQWVGDTMLFIVNQSNELQLNDTDYVHNAFIRTKSNVIYDATWKFSIRMTFNPSSSNYCKIYVGADTSVISSIHGYFIQIGGTNDNISLFKQMGNTSECIIEGRFGVLDYSNNQVHVLLKRKKNGKWLLYSDTSSSNRFIEEGNVDDPSYFYTSFFGIYCEYTKTRFDKFFFDDIEVIGQTFVPDTIAPLIDSFDISDTLGAIISFNEPINHSSLNILQFQTLLDNKIVHVQGVDEASVKVFFDKALSVGDSIYIQISGVSDTTGNILADTVIGLVFMQLRQPKKNDVVISEFLPDPEPSYGLPICEYVELFNRTTHYIDLSNCKFEDAKSTADLTGFMPPTSYIIICPIGNCSSFKHAKYCIEIENFPSLNNTNDDLRISDNDNYTIFELKYSNDWYTSPKAKNGGVSFELSDDRLNCFGQYNYHESKHPSGGTPGFKNSHSDKDTITEGIKNIFVSNDHIALETFSPVDTSLIDYIDVSCLEMDLGSEITFQSEFELSISFHSEPLHNYQFSCVAKIPFCHEHLRTNVDFTLAIPDENIRNGDLVINELYFNPPTNGSDFIELYNNSAKYISISQLILTNGNDTTNFNHSIIIGPKKYVVITEDSTFVKDRFLVNWDTRFIAVDNLIKLPDDSGIVYLLSTKLELIDIARYHEEFHNIFLLNDEDVSLERLHFSLSGIKSSSWSSASSTSNFGTPGKRNSQYYVNYSNTTLVPTKITPNGDGINDVLHIHLMFEEAGNLCNVGIFDLQGYCHSIIQRNTIMPTQSVLKWEGTNSNNEFVPTGFYFVFMECYSKSGMKTVEKLPFCIK